MSGTCSHRADSSKRCTSSTLVTTQMLTQMLLAMVSLCVLCETTVRSWPCAQAAAAARTSMRRLIRSRTLAPKSAPKRRGVAPKVHN